MPPTMNRSAALASAAQALNKPKAPQQVQGRDVTTQNGQQGIVGRGGNFQALGAAAQRRLGTPPPTVNGPNTAGGGLNPAAGRTPPTMDPNQRPGLPQVMPGVDAKVPDQVRSFPAGTVGNSGGQQAGGSASMPGLGSGGMQMPPGTARGIHQMGGMPPPPIGGAPNMGEQPGMRGVPFEPPMSIDPAQVPDFLQRLGQGGVPGMSEAPESGPMGRGPMPTKPMLRGFGGPGGPGPHGVAETPGFVPDRPMMGGPGSGENGGPGSIWGRIAGRGAKQFANADI